MQQCDRRVSEGNGKFESQTSKHGDGFVRTNTQRIEMACTKHNWFKNRLEPIFSAVELLSGLPWPWSSHGFSPSHWLFPTNHPLSRQHSRSVIIHRRLPNFSCSCIYRMFTLTSIWHPYILDFNKIIKYILEIPLLLFLYIYIYIYIKLNSIFFRTSKIKEG